MLKEVKIRQVTEGLAACCTWIWYRASGGTAMRIAPSTDCLVSRRFLGLPWLPRTWTSRRYRNAGSSSRSELRRLRCGALRTGTVCQQKRRCKRSVKDRKQCVHRGTRVWHEQQERRHLRQANCKVTWATKSVLVGQLANRGRRDTPRAKVSHIHIYIFSGPGNEYYVAIDLRRGRVGAELAPNSRESGTN